MKVKINGVEYETPVYFKEEDDNCIQYIGFIGSRFIEFRLFKDNEYGFSYDLIKAISMRIAKTGRVISEHEFIVGYQELIKRFPRFLGMNKVDGITH